MRRAVRNIWRLLRIAWILARYDALFLLEAIHAAPAVTAFARLAPRRRGLGRPGQRLAQALQRLGPSFIKFGQTLSTRSDLLGEEIARDLSELQDRLPPFSGAKARAIIEAELGRPIDELFSHFDDKPVAAASIAQVHFAVTTEGREVAVKVLRPGIEDAFARDLDLFYWVAEMAERTLPAWRRLRPVEVVRTVADSVAIEMDLRFEAAAASELRTNFAGETGFRVPAVDWSRTAQRVLTLERISGIRIDRRDALIEAGHDPEAIAAAAAQAVFNQVFRDGFFHADLHPGNLFVDADGAIVAVDFGIMGRLDTDTRRYLAEMLLGFLTGDYERVAAVHFEAGYVPAGKSKDSFIQACRSIGEPILGRPLNEISIAQLLAQLFRITETFEMETQPQLLLLQKTMLIAEGLGRTLMPEGNIWQLAQPLIEEWVRDNLGPEARARAAVRDLFGILHRLPQLVENADDALRAIAEGRAASGPEPAPRPPTAPAWPRAATAALWVIAGLLAALLALSL
jgi:ubiquinone biosynthesis protein